MILLENAHYGILSWLYYKFRIAIVPMETCLGRARQRKGRRETRLYKVWRITGSRRPPDTTSLYFVLAPKKVILLTDRVRQHSHLKSETWVNGTFLVSIESKWTIAFPLDEEIEHSCQYVYMDHHGLVDVEINYHIPVTQKWAIMVLRMTISPNWPKQRVIKDETNIQMCSTWSTVKHSLLLQWKELNFMVYPSRSHWVKIESWRKGR